MHRAARVIWIGLILVSSVACSNEKKTKGAGDDDGGETPVDTTAPALVAVEAMAHTVVRVRFSEGVAPSSVTSERFHIQGELGSIVVQAATLLPDGITVDLAVEPGMHHGQTYTLLVQGVADLADNAMSSATRDFLGRGAVVAAIEGAPSPFTAETSATISISGTDIVAYQYSLSIPGGEPTWSEERDVAVTVEIAGMLDGAHSLLVIGKDSLGNWQERDEASRADWIVDTVAPVAAFVSTPPELTASRDAEFVIGGEGVAQFSYSIDGSDWSSPQSIDLPIELELASAGSHTLSAIGGDAAGNWQELASATVFTWFVDDTPAVAELSQLPEDPTNQTAINIVVQGEDVVAYQYILDGGGVWSDEEPVAAPIAATNLVEGGHSVEVIGRDAAGNWQSEASPTLYTWTVDLTPPTATVSNEPADPTNDRTTNILVGGVEVATYRYRLDGGLWTGRFNVSQPLALGDLDEGGHTLEVVGIDLAGNEDLANPAVITWTVDLTPPSAVLSVVTPASDPTAETDVEIWVAGDDVTAYQYQLVGEGGWSSETDISVSLTESALGEGEHEVLVVGRDVAGNWQAIGDATSFCWTIDLTPPVPVLSNLPPPTTNVTSLNITVAGVDVATYMYRLDGGSWSTTRPVAGAIEESGLSEDTHTLDVRGCDDLGNCQETVDAVSHFWTVDLTAPTAILLDTPANPTNDPTASITVAGDDIVAYSFQLDGGSWSAFVDASVPLSLSGLSEADHSLNVVGRDTAGNTQEEASATTFAWTVDLTAPTASLSNLPADPTNNSGATITVAGAGVLDYQYRLDGGSWSSTTAVSVPIALTGLGETTHTLEVAGVDQAGNWQAEADATTHTWTVDQTAPQAPAVDDQVDSIDDAGIYDDELLLTFSWTNPGDAAEVAIQVATDPAFAVVVFGGSTGASVGSAESYDYVVDPANGPVYYARVRVRDSAANWSAWGTASDGIQVVGGITGQVLDSHLNQLDGAGIELRLMSDDSTVATTTTSSSGDFSLTNVPIGENAYRIEASLAGYQNATKNNVTVTVGAVTNIGVIYLVSLSASSGHINGTVVDANDGAAIGGATITVLNWESTTVATLTSNASGSFDTADVLSSPLPPGTYSILLTQIGFFDLAVDNLAVDGDRDVGHQALCEILTEPHVRVVLLWGDEPVDLDLHVVGPSEQTVTSDGDPSDRFHVYWRNQKSFNENDGTYTAAADPDGAFATTSLVQDDVTSFGPEAINLFGNAGGYAPGLYAFSVDNWSETDWYAYPITLRIYDSLGMVREIPIPTGGAGYDFWRAFRIDIQGTSRAERSVSVVNSFANGNYRSKVDMDF